MRPPPPSEGNPPRGPPISGKSLPVVGGGIALEDSPNGPPSKSSTSLLGFARAPPPITVDVAAGGGLLAGYLTFEIFSYLISSVPALATVAPAAASDPKFPAYFDALIGYCSIVDEDDGSVDIIEAAT